MTDKQWFETIFTRWLKKGWDRQMTLPEYVSILFRTKQRTITQWVCIKDVELRGALWFDSKPVPGLIDRRILQMRVGQSAFIREDDDEPFITLENSRGCVNIEKRMWYGEYKKYFEPGSRDKKSGPVESGPGAGHQSESDH